MIPITYFINVTSQFDKLEYVITSLKYGIDNVWAEYIIVDNSINEQALPLIKTHTADLARTTIITKTNFYSDFASCVKLAQTDYIHFVNSYAPIAPYSTKILLNACEDTGSQVAFALEGKLSYSQDKISQNSQSTGEIILIRDPIEEILANKPQQIRSIGFCNSMIKRALLEKIHECRNYQPIKNNFLFALCCARHSNFVFVKETVGYCMESNSANNLFFISSALNTILQFIENFPNDAECYKNEILQALYLTLTCGNVLDKTIYYPFFWIVKYSGYSLTLTKLKKIYNYYLKYFLNIQY